MDLHHVHYFMMIIVNIILRTTLSEASFSYRQRLQIKELMKKRFKTIYKCDCNDMHIRNIGLSPDGLMLIDFGVNSFKNISRNIK